MRCVNIDWLECYCLESTICNADYFLNRGYHVNVRDYGTRQYAEVFTILDQHDHPFIEVRRHPVAGALAGKSKGIFNPYSCHLRLSNRYCYAENAIDLYADFLHQHKYTIQRIFRLDIALDFETFDDGTDPKKFLMRYLSGKFTKINQGNISAHGQDKWEARDWNSVSWGAPTSMVTTKMYLKTLELKQVKDKPYIRYAWFCAGLVDDFSALTKRAQDGSVYQPNIWRIEFSIRSSAKGWYIAQDFSGKKSKTLAYEHTLDTYDTRTKLIAAFEQLAKHYFRFKVYEQGKRKDLCKDRILFKFEDSTTYVLDRLMTDTPKPRAIDALRKRLELYRCTHVDTDIRKACDILLAQLESEAVRETLPTYDRNEAELLQQLIARRMRLPTEPLSDSIEIVKSLIELSQSLF